MSFKALAIGLAVLTPGVFQAPDDPEALAVSAVRFYRPDGGQTQVKAFIQIPYSILDPAGDLSQGVVTYHVKVKVKDSTGLELVQNGWDGHAPAGVRQPGAWVLEILDFALAPGQYRVDIEVTDSVSGRKLESGIDIEGYRGQPELSDLLLAPHIRAVGADDTVPAAGEIRRGRLLITGAAEVLLTPLRSKAYYLLETYNQQDDSAGLLISVKDTAGKAIVSTPPSVARLPQGGSVLTGALDLTGLPAGRYQLTARLTLQGRTYERSAAFSMADLATTVAKAAERREAERITDAGYFSEMSEEELDEAEDPLALIAPSSQLSAYSKDLSVQAKRRFLSEFWSRRDPTPETPQNEKREQFYAAIGYANQHFREAGRSALPGWKTDRGRTYAKHGVADEVLRRSQQGTAPPYEVWRYAKGKGKYYIFADRTGYGSYNLIASDDRSATGIPNWQKILGLDVVQDISRFLGSDLINATFGENL